MSQLQSLKRTDKQMPQTDLNDGPADSLHKLKFDDKHNEAYIYSLFRLDE